MALETPPIIGAEYLTAAVLEVLWRELDAAFGIELPESRCGVQDFLPCRNRAWNLVGRVHFNGAEKRKDPDCPFAFLVKAAAVPQRKSKPRKHATSTQRRKRQARARKSRRPTED